MIQGMKLIVTESEIAQLKTLVKQAIELWHGGSPTELGNKLKHIEAFICGLGCNDTKRSMDN